MSIEHMHHLLRPLFCAMLVATACDGVPLDSPDDPPGQRHDEVEPRSGAGSAGPLAQRVSPHRMRITVPASEPLRVEIKASDAQADLRGTDLYVDGVLVEQLRISGASANFPFAVPALPPGVHTISARAFDKDSKYSESVSWIVTSVPRRRAMYVADLATVILGDPAKEDALVEFVESEAIDALIFYGLGQILATSREPEFVDLIDRLRDAGMTELGAPIAGASALVRVEAFNAAHPANHFDLVVTESEYWHDCTDPPVGYSHECASCRVSCFPPFLALLQATRELADREAKAGRAVAVGAYLGYPSVTEAEQIVALADRAYLNYTGESPAAAYTRAYSKWGAMRARLAAFAAPDPIEVWPIFYACGQANMGQWLGTHSRAEAEADFMTRLGVEDVPFIHDIVVGGFAYFSYEGFGDPPCP